MYELHVLCTERTGRSSVSVHAARPVGNLRETKFTHKTLGAVAACINTAVNLSEAVIFREWLIWRVSELLRHLARSPAVQVVVNLRE